MKNWLNISPASLFLIKFDCFLPQITQLDKRINLFCFVLLTLTFWVEIFFFTINTIGFHCFYMDNGQYFL